jgi:GcrA cell cycle regulator
MSLAEFNRTIYRNNHNTPWRADVEARFRELWARGDTASQISHVLGNEFGIKLSRNACIGKAHRLALPHRKRQPSCTDPVTLAQRAAARREYQRRYRSDQREQINHRYREWYAKTKAREEAPLIEDYSIPTPQRKTLFDLGRHDCRWPVGDPQSDLFFFCGAVVEQDKPYCTGHCARAYVETRLRY